MKTIEEILKEFESQEWSEPDHYSNVADKNVLVKYAFYCWADDLHWGPRGQEAWDEAEKMLANHNIGLEQSGGNYTYIYCYITYPANHPICNKCKMPIRESWKSRHNPKGCNYGCK